MYLNARISLAILQANLECAIALCAVVYTA